MMPVIIYTDPTCEYCGRDSRLCSHTWNEIRESAWYEFMQTYLPHRCESVVRRVLWQNPSEYGRYTADKIMDAVELLQTDE